MANYKSKFKGQQIDNLLDFVNDNKDNIAMQSDLPTVPTKVSDLTNDAGYIDSSALPTKVSDLNNDSGFIDNTVNNLINYYLKSETYTRSEINTLVNNAASGGFIKVNTLPTTDINTKAIYLVPYTGSKAKNLYEEYIYIDSDWEMIGTTKLDLSNYVTTSDLNTALNDYVTSTALNTALADYVETTDLNALIADYYTKTETDNLLDDKLDADKVGVANGVASLDSTGKVPTSQLPESSGSGVSDFNDLTNRPQKEITSIESIVDPVPLQPTHSLTGSVGFTPCGTIIAFYGDTAPTHYLACDGSEYNKSDYPELWTHLSSLTDTTPYVVDGDNTKFKVPDLRGEFLRGIGTNSHTDQGNGATDAGTHQDGTKIPYYATDSLGHVIVNEVGTSPSEEDANNDKNTNDWYWTNTTKVTSQDYTVKSYTPRPTNTSVLYCIAARDIYIDARFDYSTTEKVVGTWIDGKPIYQKTYDFVNTMDVTSNWTNTGIELPIDIIVGGGGWDIYKQYITLNFGIMTQPSSSSTLAVASWMNLTLKGITVQYTKTTD